MSLRLISLGFFLAFGLSVEGMMPSESFYIRAAMADQLRLEKENNFQESEYLPWPAEAYVGSTETPVKEGKTAKQPKAPTIARRLFDEGKHQQKVNQIESGNKLKAKVFKKSK